MMTIGLVPSLGVGRCLGWSAINSGGAVGDILVYQESKVMELVGLEMGAYSIPCCFKNCEDSVLWVFTSGYAMVCKRDKENSQDELGTIRGLWSDPWYVGGDFNLIRFPGECDREGGQTSTMRRFLEVIEELELRGFPLQGGPFTWRGGLDNQSQSRLNRFFMIENWDNLFNGTM